MSKLSKTQQEVLERLAEGNRLWDVRTIDLGIWLAPKGTDVRPATLENLKKRKAIKKQRQKNKFGVRYTISAAGRRMLEK